MPGLLRWKTAKFIIFVLVFIILIVIHLQSSHNNHETLDHPPKGRRIERDLRNNPNKINQFKVEANKQPEVSDALYYGEGVKNGKLILPDNPHPDLTTTQRQRHHQQQQQQQQQRSEEVTHNHPRNSKHIHEESTSPIHDFDVNGNEKQNKIEDLRVQPIGEADDSTSPIRHNDVDIDTNDVNHFINQDDLDSVKTLLSRLIDKDNDLIRTNKSSHVTNHDTNLDFDAIKSRFQERNARIHKVCKMEAYAEKNQNIRGRGRVVQMAHDRLSVCLVPKAGTTYLNYQLRKTLKFKEGVEDVNDSRHAHNRKRFFIAREPYGRLVSAYFSKVVSHPKWWSSLGRFIVQRIRENPSAESLYCGYDVTFPEYVKYFLMAQALNKYKNNHFIPVHEVCNPCIEDSHNMKFDYSVHLETMKEDMMYILDSVDITTDDDFRFDPVKNIVGHFMNRDERHKDCGKPWCPIFERLWWALQSNGHVDNSIPLPLKGRQCDAITPEGMLDISLQAVENSRGIIDKAAQKRAALAKMYGQVSLEDRILVRRALMMDFDLFGYDPQPDFVFSPEEIESLKK